MLTFKDLVTTLEQSRELQRLGVKGRSIFEWQVMRRDEYGEIWDVVEGTGEGIPAWTYQEILSVANRLDGLPFQNRAHDATTWLTRWVNETRVPVEVINHHLASL